MPDNKLDYELLQQLATQSSASQRGLVVRLGVSVGKVNYCLRALADNGWVKASNFRRSDNKAVRRPGYVQDLRLRAGLIPWA